MVSSSQNASNQYSTFSEQPTSRGHFYLSVWWSKPSLSFDGRSLSSSHFQLANKCTEKFQPSTKSKNLLPVIMNDDIIQKKQLEMKMISFLAEKTQTQIGGAIELCDWTSDRVLESCWVSLWIPSLSSELSRSKPNGRQQPFGQQTNKKSEESSPKCMEHVDFTP